MTPLEVSEVLPSGNETWFAGKYGKLTIEINDCPIKTSIQFGDVPAMFDYQRVSGE